VVLSTLWKPEYTQKQVEKAWKGLQERMKKWKKNGDFLKRWDTV
jgi:hypothetical protein